MWSRKFYISFFLFCLSIKVFSIDPAPVVNIKIDKSAIKDIDSIYSFTKLYNDSIDVSSNPVYEDESNYSFSTYGSIIKIKLKNQKDYYPDSIRSSIQENVKIFSKNGKIKFKYDKFTNIKNNSFFIIVTIIFLILKALLYYFQLYDDENNKKIKIDIAILSSLFLIIVACFINTYGFFILFFFLLILSFFLELIYMAIRHKGRGAFLALISYIVVFLIAFFLFFK